MPEIETIVDFSDENLRLSSTTIIKKSNKGVCEGVIIRTPYNLLGSEKGISTQATCQRCELTANCSTSNQTPRDMESHNLFIELWYESCPKLKEIY